MGTGNRERGTGGRVSPRAARPMKSSGIPWLGDVPEGWEVTRIGYLATRKQPKYAPEEELLSVFLDRGVIRFADGGSKRANVASGDFSKYQLVEPGDFVLNNQQAWRGSVGVSTYRGIISPAYLILKTKPVVDAVYANYLFRSRPLVALYEQCSHGVGSIQRNIYWDELRVQKIPFPPLPEQRAIAERIDCEVVRVDALREKIKCEIERLGDYKKSLIAETVTRGLRRRKMMPSGISWLGDVPAEWEVRKIGSLYTPRNVKVSDSDYPPLSVTKQGILPQLEHVAKSNDRDNRKLVRENDFVINSRSDRRGSCGIATQDGSVSLINIVLQPLGEMEPKYFDWLFHTTAFADEFYKWGQGIDDDIWSTHWMSMKKIVVPFPTLPEQREIAEYLDRAVSRIDAVVARRKTQLEKLESFKRSLIQEYVTGKREVCL